LPVRARRDGATTRYVQHTTHATYGMRVRLD
jgi:hypothetical protein